jgi:hypothetical protein
MSVFWIYCHLRILFEFSNSRSSITVFDVILHTRFVLYFTQYLVTYKFQLKKEDVCLLQHLYRYIYRYKRSCAVRYHIVNYVIHSTCLISTIHCILFCNPTVIQYLYYLPFKTKTILLSLEILFHIVFSVLYCEFIVCTILYVELLLIIVCVNSIQCFIIKYSALLHDVLSTKIH